MSDTISKVTYSQNDKLYAGMKKDYVRAQIDMQEFKTDNKREKAYNKQVKIFDYADGSVDVVKDGIISEEEILAYDNKEKTKNTWKTIGFIALGIGLTVGTIVTAKKLTPKIQYEIAIKKYMKEHFGRNISISEIPRTTKQDCKLIELPQEYKHGIGSFSGCDASTYAMGITSKERCIELAKTNPIVAKNMVDKPYLFEFSEEEAISKKILDSAFKKKSPLGKTCLEYRGATLKVNSPFYKKISELKKGEIYTEPGYIWTTPIPEYAFGNYASKSACAELAKETAKIQYNVLLTEGSRILCVDKCHHPETLIKGSFKVCDVIKTGNDIELFVEHII